MHYFHHPDGGHLPCGRKLGFSTIRGIIKEGLSGNGAGATGSVEGNNTRWKLSPIRGLFNAFFLQVKAACDILLRASEIIVMMSIGLEGICLTQRLFNVESMANFGQRSPKVLRQFCVAPGACRMCLRSGGGNEPFSKVRSLSVGTLSNSKRGTEWKEKFIVHAQPTKRQVWGNEPLVSKRMTKRAMLLTKELKMWWMQDEKDDVILMGTLRNWVAAMSPTRRDMLDVLKEFDTSAGRELLFKLSEWSFSEEWFKVNKMDYTKLIERYGKAGLIEDAERVVREMEERGFAIDMVVLTVILGMYGKARLLERATAIFDKIKAAGFVPDIKVYNNLMKAYGYSGLPREAEQLLEVTAAECVPATLETFCILINGYARAEQPDQAQRVFDLMISRGVKANTKAFTALLDAYGKGGDPDKAREVFESLRQHGFVPDDRAICLLIAAYEKRELMNKAVGVVVELENAGIKPGPDSLTGLISWFSKVGLVDEAEELFHEMVERGMRITPRICAMMYNAYTKAERLDSAKDFAEDMKDRGINFNRTDVRKFESSFIPQMA